MGTSGLTALSTAASAFPLTRWSSYDSRDLSRPCLKRPPLPVDLFCHPRPRAVVHFRPPSHSSCRLFRHHLVRRPKPILTLPTLIKCCAHILTPAVLDRHHLCSVGRSRSSSCHHFFQHVFLNNLRAGGWETFLLGASATSQIFQKIDLSSLKINCGCPFLL